MRYQEVDCCFYFVPRSIRVGLRISERYPEVEIVVSILYFLPGSIRVGLRTSEQYPEVEMVVSILYPTRSEFVCVSACDIRRLIVVSIFYPD